MRDEPSGLIPDLVVQTLRSHWDIDVHSLEYMPVGFGSYHWRAEDGTGGRWFVTADNLTTTGVQDGEDAEANFIGLHASMASALALRDAGLSFVLAPVASLSGEPVVRLGREWTMGLFPFVEGHGGEVGWAVQEQLRAAAATIGRLHATAPPPAIQRWLPAIPHRRALDAALGELDRAWDSGPYAEDMRDLLCSHEDALRALLADDDRAAAALMKSTEPWVVTHGEPHHANFIFTAEGLYLIDWDTVRLAPREQDLWLVVGGDTDALAAYQENAGPFQPRPDAMRLFEQRWVLKDIAFYVRRLRRPHTGSEDDAKSFAGLRMYLDPMP